MNQQDYVMKNVEILTKKKYIIKYELSIPIFYNTIYKKEYSSYCYY